MKNTEFLTVKTDNDSRREKTICVVRNVGRKIKVMPDFVKNAEQH